MTPFWTFGYATHIYILRYQHRILKFPFLALLSFKMICFLKNVEMQIGLQSPYLFK